MDAYEDKTGSHGRRTCSRFVVRARVDRHFSINIAKGVTPLWSVIFAACTVVAYIGLFFVCNFKVLSPGANDNLTGVFVAVSALKCLKESGIRYENTEVCALLTGSEEAGLRGATAFTKRHKGENKDVETYIIAFDTMRDYDYMTIYHRDMTGMVKTAPKSLRFWTKRATIPT